MKGKDLKGGARLPKIPIIIAGTVGIALVAALAFLIVRQFEKARESARYIEDNLAFGPDRDEAVDPTNPSRPLLLPERKRPQMKPLDLEGKGEPSPQDLIKMTILKYFDLLDVYGHPDDMERRRNYHENRAMLEDYLRNLGPEAVPILVDLLRNEPDYVNRKILIYGLGEMGWPEATDALREYFGDYSSFTKLRPEMYHVIRAVGVSANDRAYDTLTEWLGEADPTVASYRRWIVESLGDHPRRGDAVPIFLQEMTTAPEGLVRNKAAQAIKKVADGGQREDLRGAPLSTLLNEVQREDLPYYVRQTMMGAIGSIADPAAIPVLEGLALTNDDVQIRISAVASLRRIGTTDALAIVQKSAASDPDERIREFASKAVRQMGGQVPEPVPPAAPKAEEKG
ncbi:MAG: HEAT repeat domain-containing protein [Planctomycetes bacterium]|nr:HEAT repeat domain-containing protein [Planctomycetota bacterium]